MAKLIINPTLSSRREIDLPRSMLFIGRDPSNDVVLPDAMVSRRHAVVEYRGNQFYLRDCNSSNGSLVNGDRVTERGLRDGDLLAIGTARLLFREEPAEDVSGKVVQHPSAPRLRCRACGADHRQGDAFCRQCGVRVSEKLVPPTTVCASCGTAISLPAAFCPACGSAVGEGADSLEKTRPQDDALPAAKPRKADPPPEANPAPRAAEPAAESRPRASVSPVPALPAVAPVARPQPRPVPSAPRRVGQAPASRPAPFLRRCVAGLIDGGIALLGEAILLAPVGYYWWYREVPTDVSDVQFLPILLSLTLLPLAGGLGALYFVYFWGVRGATPGKRALGLRVERVDGGFPIGPSKAFVRLLGYAISAILLGMGFLLIALDGQGLHDRLAGTRVVERKGS